MQELRLITPSEIVPENRLDFMLLVCDESSITCVTLPKLQGIVRNSGLQTILVMPEYQFQRGLRGWSKVQVLASVASCITGVMPLDREVFETVKEGWGAIQFTGSVVWSEQDIEKVIKHAELSLNIAETRDPFDIAMIERTHENLKGSNCWYDPAGSVVVKDGFVVVEGVSTRFNQTDCKAIPLDFKDIALDSGQRIMFCDSLHSERVAITEAAKNGVQLDGGVIYVNKFPCRACMLSIISAGIKTVVFETGSYGFGETRDLVEENRITLKRVIR